MRLKINQCNLVHSKHSAIKVLLKTVSTILFTFYIALATAQESTSAVNTEVIAQPELSTALTFKTKADNDYQKKRYHEAIEQYILASTYLSNPDKATQKKLAVVYKQIAQSYKRLKNREETASFYRKALDIFSTLQDQKNMARTLNTLAEAERYLGNFKTALDYSMRGLTLHKRINDPVGHAKSLMGAGIIYRHIGRYEKSLEYVYEAYKYYKEIDNASGIAKTSNEMGLIYTRVQSFDQARFFYQQTIDLPEDEIAPKTLATAAREIAVIALNTKDYASAKIMAEKAHKIYLSENEKSKSTITARVIGNIYRDQGDTNNAILYYKQSLSLASEIGSEIYQIKAQIPLADVLIAQDTYEAIRLLKQSLILSTKIDAKPYQLDAYQKLRKAEKLQENIPESLRYAEKEIALSKVIQAENEDNQLVLVKAKLHSRKVEIELESLKETAQLDQLMLAKNKSQIEIAEQARKISELQLTKNRYANIILASLLGICFLAVLYIYRRFIASKKRNKELNLLASRDPLTNCYNRRALFDFIHRDFLHSEKLEEYCIILADIDHFKSVNDTYGHSAGDRVLCDTARILQANVTSHDIVARFGGEEFCIILPKATKEKAIQVAETIRKTIENSNFDDISITCSLGVSSIRFNAVSSAELIDQADLALFKSKSHGRNQVTLWDQSLEK